MKAIVQDQRPPDVLEFSDIDEPVVGEASPPSPARLVDVAELQDVGGAVPILHDRFHEFSSGFLGVRGVRRTLDGRTIGVRRTLVKP